MHDEGGTCVPDKCSKNEIRVNGVCVPDPDDDCPDGKKKVNGKCEKACPAHGTMAGEFKVGSTNYTSFCENKCTVVIDSFLQLIKDGKVVEYIGIGKYTGGSCNGPAYTPPDVDPKNPDPPTPPDPDKPDPEKPDPNNPGNPGGGNTGGSNPGGGNSGSSNPGSGNTGGGKPGNVNPGGGNPGSNSPPEKCPNGNCTGTGGGTPAGGSSSGVDGSCPDGTYKAGGQCYPKSPPAVDPDNDGKCPVGHKKVGGSCVAYQPTPDSETEGKDGFCKDNPSSIICKQSTFQGACESGFTCEGDAMLCAIARDQHSRNCKLFDTKNAESDLYNQEKDKKGSQIKDLEGNRQESLANRINTSDAFGSGQCIQDLAVVVAGKAVTLPFSKICPYLAIIGNIMIAISLLLAIRIVGRG